MVAPSSLSFAEMHPRPRFSAGLSSGLETVDPGYSARRATVAWQIRVIREDPRVSYGVIPFVAGAALALLGHHFTLAPVESLGVVTLTGGELVLVLANLK